MRRLNLIRNHLNSYSTKNVSVIKNIETPDFLNKGNLKGKTLFITGASRGIGLAIALKAAKDGANIAIVAKTASENKKLPGTIYSAADEIIAAGGKALPIQCDIRDEESVRKAVNLTVETFGGIDILVNNASAISLTNTEETDMKRFDLMMSINTRGTFLCSKLCIPYLKKSSNPHILTLSPPLKDNLLEKWFKPNVAYTTAKFGMSLIVLGLAGELKDHKISVNALWPRTSVATMAVKNMIGESLMKFSRKPEILADAAYYIITSDSSKHTGNFLIDDEVLAGVGIHDLSSYNIDPKLSQFDLAPDYFC